MYQPPRKSVAVAGWQEFASNELKHELERQQLQLGGPASKQVVRPILEDKKQKEEVYTSCQELFELLTIYDYRTLAEQSNVQEFPEISPIPPPTLPESTSEFPVSEYSFPIDF